MRALESVVKVSPDGYATIGTSNNPVDAVYTNVIGSVSQPVDTIHTTELVSDIFDTKGICLDDGTSLLEPSFTVFPQNWLNNTEKTGSVRTYHYGSGVDNSKWVLWLAQHGINVMIGITLSNYQLELTKLQTDYAANKSLYNERIICIAVGNEQPASELQLIKDAVTFASGLKANGLIPNVPITTVLKGGEDWIQNTYPPQNATFTPAFLELAPLLDVFCFNTYAAYSTTSVPIKVRLSWTNPSVTLNIFGAIRLAMSKTKYKSKQFWCTETGWSAPSGNANLAAFYTNFINFNTTAPFTPEQSTVEVLPPDRIFYFTVRDNRGEKFGLYTAENSKLVPKF